MINEIIFFLQTILIAGVMLGALYIGRSALMSCISLLLVLANIFVVKQINLFGFEVTSADVYIIGAVLGFNLLHEYFGQNFARRAIWISFFVSVVALVFVQLHLSYVPNRYDVTQGAFETIFGFLPRIVAASFIAHLSAQYLRFFLYRFAKRRFGSRYFIVRSVAVTVVEQAFDTLVFNFIGLYGIVYSVSHVFVLSFTIKLLAIAFTSPWLVISKFVIGSRVTGEKSE